MIILTTTTYGEAQTEINSKLSLNNEAQLSNKGGYNEIFSDNVGYQLSFMGNQGLDDSQTKKLPKVAVTEDCKKKILEKTSGSTNIVVATIFTKKSFNGNTLNIKAGITGIIDVVYYELFPYVNGAINRNQINVKNICSEKVIIYSPLYIEELLKKKAVAVAGQNPETEYEYLRDYDIFDPDSEIYKDICYPLTFSNASENIFTTDSFKNYDISLEQRKKYYFPGNTQLCPKDCNYLGFDKDTVSAICECEFTSYTLGNTAAYTAHNDYKSFTFDEEEFNDTKKDNYFTMEVFKCIKLPFTSIGFKNNYGSYLMLALICIIFLSYIILAVSGKYHLLSVLELLYNSNIKSMNYIKGSNLGGSNNFLNSNQNQYDTRSNNLLLTSQRGLTSNTLLMGNSNLNGSNANKINVVKKNNTIKDNKNIQIVNQSNLNKNKNKSQKDDLIKVDEIKENDFESEKNSEDKERTDIKSINKDISTKIENNKNEQNKNENKKSDNEKNEDDVMSEKKNEQNNAEKNDNNQNEEEEYEEEEDENENDNKANPPKKKNSNQNGEETKKKKKTPIEIALNVKELREMMLKNMPQAQKKDDDNNENNKNNNGVQNVPQANMPQNNGFPFNPFMNPMSFFPPPFPFNNNNNSNNGNNNNNNNNNEYNIRREYEERSRQREKEFQRELSQLREKERQRELERQREMEDLRERERQKQRDLDYERERRQRDELFRGYEREKTKKSDKEKDEEIEKQKEEIKKMKKKLEKELKEAENKGKEQDLELQKELSKVKDEQRQKEIEFEKELLRQKDTLREQFEKEKKEIIEKKDKEIQTLREEKDKEIQRLKEDKDREIKDMKDNMDKEKKTQNEKIKKKEKELKQELKKEKQKVKEVQKMTSNSFFMNNFNPNATLQQQIMDLNNSLKYAEKIETPQIVVPIDSIFTDQELNSMDFHNSCQFDKRTLCQVYKSYINRKQPLFFLFNYNSSSSGSVSTFQINYTSVKFIIFCIELMIYLFFYCTFFGSHSITDILNNDFTFKKKCVFAIILSPICMICKSVIHHFIYDKMNVKIAEIKMRCYTNFIVGKKPEEIKVNEFKDFWESEGEQQKEIKEEKKEEMADIQEIEDDNLPEEEKERRKEKYEKRRLKILIKDLIELFKRKILISIIIITPSLFVEWYYVSAFCAVYKNSQLTFFLNIFISYGFSNLIPFFYCMIPTLFRQDAIKEESKLAFFINQILQII